MEALKEMGCACERCGEARVVSADGRWCAGCLEEVWSEQLAEVDRKRRRVVKADFVVGELDQIAVVHRL